MVKMVFPLFDMGGTNCSQVTKLSLESCTEPIQIELFKFTVTVRGATGLEKLRIILGLRETWVCPSTGVKLVRTKSGNLGPSAPSTFAEVSGSSPLQENKIKKIKIFKKFFKPSLSKNTPKKKVNS